MSYRWDTGKDYRIQETKCWHRFLFKHLPNRMKQTPQGRLKKCHGSMDLGEEQGKGSPVRLYWITRRIRASHCLKSLKFVVASDMNARTARMQYMTLVDIH